MSDKIHLESILTLPGRTPIEKLELFALLNLGVLESMSHGLMSASDAVRTFYHAENSLFVRRQLPDQIADEIMSRGVQLPDLFEALPTEEAQREFQRELTKIHTLCLSLLEQKLVAA